MWHSCITHKNQFVIACYVFSVVAKLISTGTGKTQDRSLHTNVIFWYVKTPHNCNGTSHDAQRMFMYVATQ